MIFIASPMPNHMMASGMIASVGMARLIWIGPSTIDSPMRLSPEIRARTTPTPPTPMTSEMAASRREARMLVGRRPSDQLHPFRGVRVDPVEGVDEDTDEVA